MRARGQLLAGEFGFAGVEMGDENGPAVILKSHGAGGLASTLNTGGEGQGERDGLAHLDGCGAALQADVTSLPFGACYRPRFAETQIDRIGTGSLD